MASVAERPLDTELPKGHFIGGTWVAPAAAKTFDVVDPTIRHIACTLPVGRPRSVDTRPLPNAPAAVDDEVGSVDEP